jgi:ABC-type uncharacterized transport system ATPase subunit
VQVAQCAHWTDEFGINATSLHNQHLLVLVQHAVEHQLLGVGGQGEEEQEEAVCTLHSAHCMGMHTMQSDKVTSNARTRRKATEISFMREGRYKQCLAGAGPRQQHKCNQDW